MVEAIFAFKEINKYGDVLTEDSTLHFSKKVKVLGLGDLAKVLDRIDGVLKGGLSA
jgi:hypothetical protein